MTETLRGQDYSAFNRTNGNEKRDVIEMVYSLEDGVAHRYHVYSWIGAEDGRA